MHRQTKWRWHDQARKQVTNVFNEIACGVPYVVRWMLSPTIPGDWKSKRRLRNVAADYTRNTTVLNSRPRDSAHHQTIQGPRESGESIRPEKRSNLEFRCKHACG
jgi:hypothetical protein